MIPLFLGLTFFNLLCLLATAALGYAGWTQHHQLAGVLATLACCAVHCVVFTYFIATAKWIQHAIEVKKLDPAVAQPTRSFKAHAFPAALAAMFTVFFAAILGVLRLSYGINPLWHQVMALCAITANICVAFVEYAAIARNARLIDGILQIINEHNAAV